MSKKDAKDFASTKHKKLPDKVVAKEESNPRIPRKKGQPANSKKHSDLYTDENPKGTIHGLGKDVATAKASVSKIRFIKISCSQNPGSSCYGTESKRNG